MGMREVLGVKGLGKEKKRKKTCGHGQQCLTVQMSVEVEVEKGIMEKNGDRKIVIK